MKRVMDSSGSPSFSGTWENDLLRHLILEHIQKTGRNAEIGPREISDVIDRVAPKCAKSLFETLKKDTPEMIAYENSRRTVFAADNYSHWKEPFDKLEMMLKISCEVVKEFIKDAGPFFNNEERLLFKAISALHGNGCLVAQEIFALMRAGYA
ncbi:MAG TPA: hypothetical protein HA263_11685, partial [Methanoregulaceae archaeon]|nr:hypothetical protein [Methanoregulaceae archaeon]